MSSAVLSVVLAAAVTSTCTDCLEKQAEIDYLSVDIVGYESELFWSQYMLDTLESQRAIAQQLLRSLLANKPVNWEARRANMAAYLAEIIIEIAMEETNKSSLEAHRDTAQAEIYSLEDDIEECTVCN